MRWPLPSRPTRQWPKQRMRMAREHSNVNPKMQVLLEEWKTSAAYGLAAMRAAMIINGAAAVALLAYLVKVTLEPGTDPSLLIPLAMLCYLGGVLAAAIASGCAYLGLKVIADTDDDDDGNDKAISRFIGGAIVLVITAYVTFTVGGILSYLHFTTGYVVPGT